MAPNITHQQPVRKIPDQEMQILLQSYSTDFETYYKEIDSRRDYLKWFTSITGAGVAICGYFLQHNTQLSFVVLFGLLLLGIGTFRVVLSSSITALYAFVRFNNVHQYWLDTYPHLRFSCPLRSMNFSPMKKHNFIGFLLMPQPYIVQIVIVINAIIAASMTAVLWWKLLDYKRVAYVLVYSFLAFVVMLCSQRYIGARKYSQAKELVIKANNKNRSEVFSNEEEEK